MAIEYWLRGPVEGVPGLLQPVAHALLQSRDEIIEALKDFPEESLWKQPGEVASVAFHLQHLAGVMDRLFAYADQKELSNEQLDYLSEEGKENADSKLSDLLDHFIRQVDISISKLKNVSETSLTDARGVGRKQIPSTRMGLLFHTAEHTMRHTGQLLVTIKWVKAG